MARIAVAMGIHVVVMVGRLLWKRWPGLHVTDTTLWRSVSVELCSALTTGSNGSHDAAEKKRVLTVDLFYYKDIFVLLLMG